MTEAAATQTSIVRWVVLVQLTALPAWLSLSRAERGRVAEQVRELGRAHSMVRLRWIDVEAFTAECSDLLLAETSEPPAWIHLFEELRDSVLFTTPYFRLERIATGIEDGYLHYDAATGAGGPS